VPDLVTREDVTEALLRSRTIVRVDKIDERPPHHLLGRITKRALERRVDRP
jgi:hypothetical protein